MRACHKHHVKRVVITSSLSAIVAQKPENNRDVYTENDWSDLEACTAYDKSKTLAEKAAWDFLYSLPESERFELVVINPVFILGPALVHSDSSPTAVKLLMGGKIPFLPKVMLVLVDVRECALAHLRALTVPEARNQRFILGSSSLWIKDIAVMLKASFPDYPVPSREIGYCPIKFASFFSSKVKILLPQWNRVLKIDNSRSKSVLGIEYRDPVETLEAMAKYLIESGAIPDKRK